MERLLYLILLTILMISPLNMYGQNVRLATFNIRYDNKNDGVNVWNFRKENLCEFLYGEKKDIICLQEVVKNQRDDISQSLVGYSDAYSGRDDGNEKGLGLSIYYNSKRFVCLDTGKFWLSEHPDSVGTKGWDADQIRNALWVKLQFKKSKRVIYVVNTHLDHKGKSARKNSMQLIKDRMKKIAGEHPIILTGDMNSSTNSVVYKIAIEEEMKMIDALLAAKKRSGVEYSFHDFGKLDQSCRKRIDFIFVSEGIKVRKAMIPLEKDINGTYMSDHCPVIADLKIK